MGFKKKYKGLLFLLLMVLGGVKCLSAISGFGVQPVVHWNHKVYVAFGFHGNLYHSFRGDTNDDSGFGRDIRVIRHIIRTLDRFNRRGVPVTASWDFDNHFSLERLLPVHAPDIIRDIRRRVDQGRDEVLLMSYNNGLASAMTEKELTDTVNWAVSNPWGSGVKDIFGTYTPVVRPQEMMTSPGNFKIYRQAGIKAVSLYYSAAPFDAFRVFSRELSREEAYNPLVYKNDLTREKMTIIPTYNIGDLVENISLGNWVAQLHRMQRQGVINRDVLIFINFDADSEYWTGADQLKWPLSQLPNTKGLEGLIREVKDRNYVRFTTLKNYLEDHGPAGTVRFQQDTADGSFDGYNSWSEKRGSTDYWTRIMAARRIHEAAAGAGALLDDADLEARIRPLMDEAYLVRLTAMSTTNFGMSTPFLAPQREAVMEKTLDRLDRLGDQIRSSVEQAFETQIKDFDPLPKGWTGLSPLMTVSPKSAGSGGSRFLTLPRERVAETLASGKQLYLKRKGSSVALVPLPGIGNKGPVRFYVLGPAPDGVYLLCSGPEQNRQTGSARLVSTGNGVRLETHDLSLAFDRSGKLEYLKREGESVLKPGSLFPWFLYEDVRFEPEAMGITQEPGKKGMASLELAGRWPGPDSRTLSEGSVRYRYTLVEGLPYLFVAGDVRYPTTAGTDVMKSDVRNLARGMDMGWQEVAPAELCLAARASRKTPVRVLKNNYMDVDSGYPLDYFRHSPENLNLDNVNNHITAGYAGLAAGGQGLALGFDQRMAANFAGAPVRVRHNPETDGFSAAINPFGTYYGKQNRRPTRGNGLGHEAALISGEQYHSAAPTFNGRNSRFALMVGCFRGDQVPASVRRDLKAFANPAVVFMPGRAGTAAAQPAVSPVEYAVSMDQGRVLFSWEAAKRAAAEYVVRIGTDPGKYTHVFLTRQNCLALKGLTPHKPFVSGQRYYAVIEAVDARGGIPARTREIRLDILDANHISAQAHIPWQFPLKVIWANLKALF